MQNGHQKKVYSTYRIPSRRDPKEVSKEPRKGVGLRILLLSSTKIQKANKLDTSHLNAKKKKQMKW